MSSTCPRSSALDPMALAPSFLAYLRASSSLRSLGVGQRNAAAGEGERRLQDVDHRLVCLAGVGARVQGGFPGDAPLEPELLQEGVDAQLATVDAGLPGGDELDVKFDIHIAIMCIHAYYDNIIRVLFRTFTRRVTF